MQLKMQRKVIMVDAIDRMLGAVIEWISFIYRPSCWVHGHVPYRKKVYGHGMSWEILKCETCNKRLNFKRDLE